VASPWISAEERRKNHKTLWWYLNLFYIFEEELLGNANTQWQEFVDPAFQPSMRRRTRFF